MPTVKQRYLFIDLLRFTAVIVMLQGHTFDALLSPDVKQASLFFIHDFFHGFVAPMFLFASGVAFGVSTMKKWEVHSHFSRPVAKRIARFIGLVIIGYALHLPFFSLPKILYNSTPQEVAAMLQVDALHCIAVTLLTVQLAVMVCGTPRRLAIGALAVALAIVFAAPVIWSLPLLSVMPIAVASYFNAENHSWFPLVPYSSFVLFGVVYAWLFLQAKERRMTVRFMQRGVVFGMVAIALAVLAANIPATFYGPHDFWKVNPAVITARVGFLMIAASSLFFTEQIIHVPPKLPAIMGSESLFIYIVHLLIIYGSVINNGLQQYWGARLSFWQALGVFFIVFVAMSMFAYGWHIFKTRYKGWALFTRIAIVWLLVFYFLSRPY
ncbi:MAG TPA: heparan-alpha-glucosaminide N-acetyltransferase domain-containing protein [Bacteroidota bacterium]|nr:heparan-alpha-glucosaminide N-acetyltransferase domain-containing protein [Bacteroidota bacterium]